MQKEIEKQIKAELDKIKRKYLDSADEIFSDFNKEGQTAGDYNGRQIYKLLQNAEDAANGFGEVLIEFKKNKFSISNTGVLSNAHEFALRSLTKLLKNAKFKMTNLR